DRGRVAELHPQIAEVGALGVPPLRVAKLRDPEDRGILPHDNRLLPDRTPRARGLPIPGPELERALRRRHADLEVPDVVPRGQGYPERPDHLRSMDEDARGPRHDLEKTGVAPA